MSITNGEIAESCGIWMDGRQLPVTVAEASDDLVALSPIEISWGVSKPWDTPTAAVASLTLADPHGRYSKSLRALTGKRITIRPLYSDWTYTAANGNDNLAYYAVFDGMITSAEIDMSHDIPRIKITAADRLRNAALDTRQWPNINIDANRAKGYQGWQIGATSTVADRLKSIGIGGSTFSYTTFPVPYEKSESVSIIDFLSNIWTQTINGKLVWRYNAPPFLSYVPDDPFTAPVYRQYGHIYNPRFIQIDGGTATEIEIDNGVRTQTALGKHSVHLDSMDILCDDSSTLSIPSKITDLKLAYFHRTLSNASATDSQRAQEDTYYTWSQDAERLVIVDDSSAADKTIQEFTTRWTDYDNETKFASVDVSGLVESIQTSNRRIRLPEISFRSDKITNSKWYATKPNIFAPYANRFEPINADTHGAWLTLGGVLTYDAARQIGRWKNTITNLWPLPPAIAEQSQWPTFSDWEAMSSADTFAQGSWKFGVLRYTNEIKKG